MKSIPVLLMTVLLTATPASAASFIGRPTGSEEWTYDLTYEVLENYSIYQPTTTITLTGLFGVYAAEGPTRTDFPDPGADAGNKNWKAEVLDGGKTVRWTHDGPGTGNWDIAKHVIGFRLFARDATNGLVNLKTSGFSRDINWPAPDGGPWITDVATSVAGPSGAKPIVRFRDGRLAISETGSAIEVMVQRQGGIDLISVEYETKDASAKAGEDYSAVSGTLHFAAGETSKTIIVPVLNDSVGEADEAFEVVLSNLSEGVALGSVTTSEVTIQNDDRVILPYAATLAAFVVEKSNAILNGMATPNGFKTLAWFEWGTTAEYGRSTGPVAVGTGTSVVHVKAQIEGLIAKQTYHCRLVVSNAAGIAFGHEVLFTTGARVAAWGSYVGLPNDTLYPFPLPAGLSNVVAVAGAVEGGESIALFNDGTISAPWGYFSNSLGSANTILAMKDIASISLGLGHAVMMRTNGTIAALGFIPVPATVAGSSEFAAVVAGRSHAMALRKDGTVLAWGDTTFGQTKVLPGLSNVVAIAAGTTHSVALRNDGTAVAWGSENSPGSLGPADVPVGLTNVVAIAAGSGHTVVLRNDGNVVTWGGSQDQRHGVPGLSNVVAVAGGTSHSLALKKDGTVFSWGLLLGEERFRLNGVARTLRNLAGIAAGSFHALALGQNSPPVAVLQTYSGPADTDLLITLSGSDLNGDSLTYRILTLPLSGTLYQYNNGGREALIITPNTTVTDPAGRIILSPDGLENIEARFSFAANDGEVDSEPTQVTATIGNPNFFRLQSGSMSIHEPSHQAIVTVTRAGKSLGAASVDYSTSDGTGIAGRDYTATSGTLDFVAGETSKTITVPILTDSIIEANESFTLRLTARADDLPVGAPGAVEVTVVDDDTFTGQPGSQLNPVPVGSWPGQRRGPAYDVAMSGDFAYVAALQAGLQIFDLTNPGVPRLVGGYLTRGNAMAVGVTGRYVLLTDDALGLHVLDATDPSNLKEVGSYTTRWVPRSVTIAGNYAYVTEGEGGYTTVTLGGQLHGRLYIFDISNPAELRLVVAFDLGADAFDVAIVGQYALVGAGRWSTSDLLVHDSMLVIDISNPAAPRRVAAIDTGAPGLSVAVSGKSAFVAGGNGLTAVDISDPTRPKLAGRIVTSGEALSVAMSGNYAFVTGQTPNGFQVIDTSRPDSPVRVGSVETTGVAADVAVLGLRAVIADAASGIQVIDITDPKNPRLQGASDSNGAATAVAMSGEVLFLADGTGGIKSFDVTNPAQPRWIGHYPFLGGDTQSMVVTGNYLYLASRNSREAPFVVFDISNPSALRRVGEYGRDGFGGSVSGLAVIGHFAYLAEGWYDESRQKSRGRLVILDLTTPSNPTRIGSLDTDFDLGGVAVAGAYAYLIEKRFVNGLWNAALSVIDISQPAAPVRVAEFEIGGEGAKITLAGNHAYLSGGTNPGGILERNFQVIDISNPFQPRRVGLLPLGNNSEEIVVQGTRLFLANRYEGVIVLDVSNPSQPRRIWGYFKDGKDDMQGLALANGYAFVANYMDGLLVLDTATRIQFAESSIAGFEEDRTATIRVNRSGVTSFPVQVNYSSVAGTATAGMDFEPVSGVLDFPAGANGRTFSVPLIDDALDDSSETIRLELSSPSVAGLLGSVSKAALTIQDRPASVEFTSSEVTVSEGVNQAVIFVLRRGDQPSSFSVNLTVVSANATPGVDFTAPATTLTFAAGEISKTITIPILDDGLVEGDEKSELRLSDPNSGAALGTTSTATITIRDNERPVSAVDGGFDAKLPSNTGVALIFPLADGKTLIRDSVGGSLLRLDGHGRPDPTFVPNAQIESFRGASPDGSIFALQPVHGEESTSRLELIKIRPDGSPDSIFKVTFIGPFPSLDGVHSTPDGKLLAYGHFVGVNGTDATGLVRLNADGSVDPSFHSAISALSVGPLQSGEQLLVWVPPAPTDRDGLGKLVRLNADGSIDASFAPALNLPQAMPGIPGGSARRVTTMARQPDGKILVAWESNQIDWTVGGLVRLNTDGSLDSSFAPKLNFFSINRLAVQTDGKILVSFTAYEPPHPNPMGRSQYSATARLNTDGSFDATFAPETERMSTAAGVVHKGISNFAVQSDGRILLSGAFKQPDGSVQNRLARLFPDSSKVTVLQLASGSVRVNESDRAITVIVERLGDTTGTATVDYAVNDGSAVAGSDFTATQGRLTFASLEVSKSLMIPILDDARLEAEETFTVELKSPSAGAYLGAIAATSVVITDDDNEVEFSGARTEVSETGRTVVITVRRNGSRVASASVGYSTQDGSATNGRDFTAQSGTLTFAPGQETATFNVTILDDELEEEDETVQLTLSNPHGTTLGTTSSATLGIQDDDGRSEVRFESSEYFAEEGAGDTYMYLVRTGNPRHAVSVGFIASDGTATANSDFASLSGTITFAENQVRQAIRIPILDDTQREQGESFTIRLVNPSSGAVINGNDTATVNIADNDGVGGNPLSLIGSWPGFARGEGESVAISGNHGYVVCQREDSEI